jgi:hypothetical protein
MEWSGVRHAFGDTRLVGRIGALLACALALCGCNPESQNISVASPRGATVAFDSVDGLPAGRFQKLVQDLNDEAQVRRLAVISREQPSAYRVRGYLAAKVAKHQTTITWVWDIFDPNEQRALRLSGEETAKFRHKDAWAAADDAMLRRIANTSMEQLAAFLTSPEVAPGTAPGPVPALGQAAAVAAVAAPAESSPEAAGIFRISYPHADPISTDTGESAAEDESVAVPLPRRRPEAIVAATETLTFAARR